jgi:hypothetical protein
MNPTFKTRLRLNYPSFEDHAATGVLLVLGTNNHLHGGGACAVVGTGTTSQWGAVVGRGRQAEGGMRWWGCSGGGGGGGGGGARASGMRVCEYVCL